MVLIPTKSPVWFIDLMEAIIGTSKFHLEDLVDEESEYPVLVIKHKPTGITATMIVHKEEEDGHSR